MGIFGTIGKALGGAVGMGGGIGKALGGAAGQVARPASSASPTGGGGALQTAANKVTAARDARKVSAPPASSRRFGRAMTRGRR